jgi:hypothetical protein
LIAPDNPTTTAVPVTFAKLDANAAPASALVDDDPDPYAPRPTKAMEIKSRARLHSMDVETGHAMRSWLTSSRRVRVVDDEDDETYSSCSSSSSDDHGSVSSTRGVRIVDSRWVDAE